MPYGSVKDVPDHVPAAKRKQWLEVFNSAYASAIDDGKNKDDAEGAAFAQANAVAGPNAEKLALTEWNQFQRAARREGLGLGKRIGTKVSGLTREVNGPFRCDHCSFFDKAAGLPEGYDAYCDSPLVALDPEVAGHDGRKMVRDGECCEDYEPTLAKERRMKTTFKKFIPFAKVDAVKREVWGVVTAEQPDKDDEVCDYAKSKPFYEAVIAEISQASDGKNFFPLREMHQLSAVGKGIGFDFRDPDKEIFMGFRVVDDAAWKKVDEGVYTGFSHGGVKVGEMEPDPVFKGCMRYVANPSEVSLVDNPCLGAAHFAYVKADGSVELRKLKSEPAAVVSADRFSKIIRDVEDLKSRVPVINKGKTKRVAGEDLSSSAFLIVGDKDKTDTWKLPIKFSNEAKTKRHIRNALARFGQLKDVSAADKDAAWKRLVAAAKQYDVNVEAEKVKLAAIQDHLRKLVRVRVNRLARAKTSADLGHALTFVDDDLGRLAKGLYDVGRLACCVQELGYMLYNVIAEQEWEQDEDSPVPAMLAANVNDLLDTLVAYAAEEVEEFREEINARV